MRWYRDWIDVSDEVRRDKEQKEREGLESRGSIERG